jgi:hypothetical protein
VTDNNDAWWKPEINFTQIPAEYRKKISNKADVTFNIYNAYYVRQDRKLCGHSRLSHY